MNARTQPALVISVLVSGLFPPAFAQAVADEREKKEAPPMERVELSPFIVQVDSEQGYYASQTLAGGRLRQDLKDIGTSIQVVTKEFMEDLAVTGVEELFQYTTGTEVGGILGNFTGAADNVDGETSTGEARRNPDGTTRVRGLAAPDRTRNFFKTEIPFDAYNTDRIDINRGANSFLFGLGSPAGLTNTGMVKARFRDTNEISTRIGTAADTPSFRGSFNLNRVLKKDMLALHAAALMDRTKYRQEPAFKDDDRQYLAATFRPFKHADTVISAHMENGRIRGTAPDVLLPQQNLTTFLNDPTVGRLSFDTYANLQRFGHPEGPTQAQYNGLSAAEKTRFAVRDTPRPNSIYNGNWGNGAYGLVYDGTNGALPAFAYTAQYRAADYQVRDPFFAPGRNARGAPYNVYHGNLSDIMGPGWVDQGFTDLRTFDFTKATLAWDNDYYAREFVNYNVALEQVLLNGQAGFELAYDFQDLFKRDYVSFNAGVSRVLLDVNKTLWLPADPNYRTSGNATPVPNPNYGRPMVMTKAASRTTDLQNEAARFTGFYKFDFAKHTQRRLLGQLLGRHTITGLLDKATFDEKLINRAYNSFGDPEPALHIGPANARQTSNGVRDVPRISYIGPPQLNAFTDPNFTLGDFVIEPAKYRLRLPDDYSINKLSWNFGPDANNQNIGLESRLNGNEGFVPGRLDVREVPAKNYRVKQTRVKSFAVNTQSFFLDGMLVANTGYRVDDVRTWLNTEGNLIGLDEIPDLAPEAFRVEDGNLVKTRSDIFGYGGVFNVPTRFLKLPNWFKVSLHYNTTENFIPATERVDQFRRPVAPPSGRTRDYGATVFLWDNKLVARVNWYKSTLGGATAPISGLFNDTNTDIFNHFGNLNRALLAIDGNDDGVIDAAAYDQVDVNPATGLTPEGLTREQAVQALYPGFQKAREARRAIAPQLTDALKTAYNYRMAPDGASQTQFAGAVTDTNDIESRGLELELTYNPTRNLRVALNVAKQETILSNMAPGLTQLLNDVWLPHLANFGSLDWDNPTEVVNGNTVREQINTRIVDYFTYKGQEGRPQNEQRKWRANVVTRYQFSEGRLRGFSVGGAIRWQDSFAAGYPLIADARGIIIPDVANPYMAESAANFDLTLGYRRRILTNKDWTVQLNFRNLQNLNSDELAVVRVQPDGTIARVRFEPPFEVLLTNTFRF